MCAVVYLARCGSGDVFHGRNPLGDLVAPLHRTGYLPDARSQLRESSVRIWGFRA